MKKKRKVNEIPEDIVKRSTRHMRIMEIMEEQGTGEKWKLPSDMFGRDELLRTYCAMCSKPMAIRPRFYGRWFRRKDGTIAFLCDGCDRTPAAPSRSNRGER